ncbi:unnamed protein product, partial [Discosporangium mesarthrocarpum]
MRFTIGQALHTGYILLLPAIVASLGLGPLISLGLVLFYLFWGWFMKLISIESKPSEMTLETMSVSHFAEKVRWSLDRCGIDYKEEVDVGILGVFLTTRRIPRLHVSAGVTLSNSSTILRYLYGQFVGSKTFAEKVHFLKPTPEALELERRLDAHGIDLQHFFYYHVLASGTAERRLRLYMWGATDTRTPLWQRLLLHVLEPVLTAFMKAVPFQPSQYGKVMRD